MTQTLALTLAAAALLAGCYVVHMGPDGKPVTVQPAAVQPATPPAAQFTARLYPQNEAARRYGLVQATVTHNHTGHGAFSATIGGERFTGDATRQSASSREGTANGAGERGNYINCTYRMNDSALGSGKCRMNDGAEFAMHIGG